MNDIFEPQGGATTKYCDNELAITTSQNPVFHRKTKHIKVKQHFIRETQNEREDKLEEIKGEDQLEDIFTKALPKGRFEIIKAMLGMRDKSSKEEC